MIETKLTGKPYTAWSYLWPPRPEQAITASQFDYFENRGFIAQKKKNGQCVVLGFGPNGERQFWDRHQEPLKWVMPKDIEAVLRGLGDPNSWKVLVGELLHAKVKKENGGIKDTLYIFDVLVWNGVYLVGTSYEDRLNILHDAIRFINQEKIVPMSHVQIHPKIWIAKSFKGAAAEFANINPDGLDEGIVLKDPKARLEPCNRQSANSGTMVKCRWAKKNFAT